MHLSKIKIKLCSRLQAKLWDFVKDVVHCGPVVVNEAWIMAKASKFTVAQNNDIEIKVEKLHRFITHDRLLPNEFYLFILFLISEVW